MCKSFIDARGSFWHSYFNDTWTYGVKLFFFGSKGCKMFCKWRQDVGGDEVWLAFPLGFMGGRVTGNACVRTWEWGPVALCKKIFWYFSGWPVGWDEYEEYLVLAKRIMLLVATMFAWQTICQTLVSTDREQIEIFMSICDADLFITISFRQNLILLLYTLFKSL